MRATVCFAHCGHFFRGHERAPPTSRCPACLTTDSPKVIPSASLRAPERNAQERGPTDEEQADMDDTVRPAAPERGAGERGRPSSDPLQSDPDPAVDLRAARSRRDAEEISALVAESCTTESKTGDTESAGILDGNGQEIMPFDVDFEKMYAPSFSLRTDTNIQETMRGKGDAAFLPESRTIGLEPPADSHKDTFESLHQTEALPNIGDDKRFKELRVTISVSYFEETKSQTSQRFHESDNYENEAIEKQPAATIGQLHLFVQEVLRAILEPARLIKHLMIPQMSVGRRSLPHDTTALPIYPQSIEEGLAWINFRSPDRERMNVEGFRVGTFLFYTQAGIHAVLRLANAGFYYTGKGDTLACFCCDATFSYAERIRSKDPYDIHRELNPNCPHLTSRNAGNMFIQREQTRVASGRDITGSMPQSAPAQHVSEIRKNLQALLRVEKSTPPLNSNRQNQSRSTVDGASNLQVPDQSRRYENNANTTNVAERPSTSNEPDPPTVYNPSQAVHPRYTTLRQREASFAQWPDTHAQSPRELAVAGFFFTGSGDRVRCHYCGLGLMHWDTDDTPHKEHMRWRSTCGFLRILFGDEFIFKTLHQLSSMLTGEVSSATSGLETIVAADLMTSEAAEAARVMGFPNDVIERAIRALLSTRAGHHAVTTQNLANAILYLQARGRDPEIPETSDDDNSDNDDDDNRDDDRRPGIGEGDSDDNTPAQDHHTPSNGGDEGPSPAREVVRGSSQGPGGPGLQTAPAQPPHSGNRRPKSSDTAYRPALAVHPSYTTLKQLEASFAQWPDTRAQSPRELVEAGFFYTESSATAYRPALAVHPRYTNLGQREASFAQWPDTRAQSPRELAQAGFFYTGADDVVQCYYCGLRLKDWEKDDIPLKEHMRWRSTCGFLRTSFGDNSLIETLHQISSRLTGEVSSATSGSETIVAAVLVADLMTSEAAEAARAMGFPNDVIERAIRALLSTSAGLRAVTTQNLVNTILYLQDRGRDPDSPKPSDDDNSDNDDDYNRDDDRRPGIGGGDPDDNTPPQGHHTPSNRGDEGPSPAREVVRGSSQGPGDPGLQTAPAQPPHSGNRRPTQAVHLRYMNLSQREASFAQWPDTHAQSPLELAQAGFFYTGAGNRVRCYCCGLELTDSNPDYTPLEEHTRWRSTCGFLRTSFGDDFIAETLRQITLRLNGGVSSATSGSETIVAEAAEAARAMGFPNDVIERAIRALLSTTAGRRAVTTQNLVNSILYLQARGRDPDSPEPSDDDNSDNDDDDNRDDDRSPGIGEGDSDDNTPPQGHHTPSNSGDEGPSPAREVVRGSSQGSGGPGFQTAPAQPPHSGNRRPNRESQQTLRELEQENQELRERRRCKICLDNDVSILFLPCGHLVCCAECAPALRRCPMCRKRITGTVRIQLSALPPDNNTH